MYTQQDRKGGRVMVACRWWGGGGGRNGRGEGAGGVCVCGGGEVRERDRKEGRRGGRHLLICSCRSLY